jgi:hypothetical protein
MADMLDHYQLALSWGGGGGQIQNVPGFERFMLSFEVLSFEAWFVEK